MIVRGGLPKCIVKAGFLPEKSRLAAFAALQQDQHHRLVRSVAYQTQPFRLKTGINGAGAKLGQLFRLVDDVEVAAVFQRLRSNGK